LAVADSDLGPLDVVLPGITPWLMGEYFKDLGGVDLGGGWSGAEGWRARVLPAEDFVIGSLRVGRIRLQVEGTPEALARVRPLLDLKLIRGGG
jgi:hypothetical protein